MGAFKAKEVDTSERGVITIVGIVGVILGVVGGWALFRELDGTRAVESAYWTTLVTISALSALPLVAMATYTCRLWFGTGTRAWWLVSPIIVSLAILVSLVGIVLCVYEIAVTSGSSDPHDGVLLVATLVAAAALGATVFAVAFAIVDKIDPGGGSGG
jgi:hypothetical protein